MSDAAGTDPVVFDEREAAGGRRIGFARLDRAAQLNALNLPMCQLLLERFGRWASDESIACVVLEGAGDKGFCAGGDVAEIARQIRAGGPRRFVYGDAFFEAEYRLDRLMHEYPKPLVAWAHGITMGGGLGLLEGASHRIVSEGSRLAMPEIHIGLFADVAGGWFLNRMPGRAGVLMALTGAVADEADALYGGLADWFLPAGQRAATWQALAALDWCGHPRRDAAALTALLNRLAAQAREAGARLPRSALLERFDAIHAIGLQPDVVAMRDALQRAAARDAWFEPLVANLAAGSPTGAHVNFAYLQRARRLSLAQTLALDLALARAFQREHDFSEGVRARLIDKDRAPRWAPARLEDVPAELVERHFGNWTPTA